ncbi:hypothetical protein RIF29_32183 [Crotalaria pallida]|uniref:Uncharacterized protein n=1 Tax=Crotalaria pallida TaxID=3830 RepID=A0AAN9EIR1_CROPI
MVMVMGHSLSDEIEEGLPSAYLDVDKSNSSTATLAFQISKPSLAASASVQTLVLASALVGSTTMKPENEMLDSGWHPRR